VRLRSDFRQLPGWTTRGRSSGSKWICGYPFLPAAEAEPLRRAGRPAEAAARLRRALLPARSPVEVALLRRKLEACAGTATRGDWSTLEGRFTARRKSRPHT